MSVMRRLTQFIARSGGRTTRYWLWDNSTVCTTDILRIECWHHSRNFSSEFYLRIGVSYLLIRYCTGTFPLVVN